MERYFTQADFAALTGLTTITINRKVASGEIKTTPNGIPECQLYQFQCRQLAAQKNILYIFVEDGKTNIDIEKERVTEGYSSMSDAPIFIEDFNGYLQSLVNYVPDLNNEDECNAFCNIYNDCVLHFLIDKYDKKLFSSYRKLKALGLLTLGEDFMLDNICLSYEKFKQNCTQRGIEASQYEKSFKTLHNVMKAEYRQICATLNLTTKNGDPAIPFHQITSKFIQGVREKNGLLYQDIVGVKDIIQGKWTKEPLKLLFFEPVKKEALRKIRTKYFKLNKDFKNGFYSFMTLNPECTEDMYENLITLALSNVYSDICFTCTEKTYQEKLPNSIKNCIQMFTKYSSATLYFY